MSHENRAIRVIGDRGTLNQIGVTTFYHLSVYYNKTPSTFKIKVCL